MPSRFARLMAMVALVSMLAATPSLAQQLTMPSDPLAGTVIESDTPAAGAVQLTPSANSIPMGGDFGMAMGGAPTRASSSGGYYNPTLGSHIRATYTTQSYGQEAGVLTLGTMKLFPTDGGVSFLDGQVTLNDKSTVGYNVGLGYRWMTLPLFPFSPDDEKIMGVSLWSDGQSVGGDNFFPQVGVALEFLGDHLDFRANGYAPVGQRTQTRDFVDIGEITFSGNGIGALLQGIQDTALTVGEAEVAGRIADLDAWVFGGVYGFNGGVYDGVGGKVGLRGYATPDLLVSIAVANDDEFDTNALFGITWFIGRTRAENCPTGNLRDRFREPVVRNNYVATQQSVAFSSADSLLNSNGQAIRIVHVDSSAAAGGDGTFENPLNSLNDINGNSLADDIVLAHGGSVFTGQGAVLQDGQTFVGEGGNNAFSVNTFRFGAIDLPETSAGAQAGAIPTINGAPAAGVTLANNNIVQNLAFDGGVNAITSSATGSFNSTLQDLTISNTSGDAISLAAVVLADVNDVNNNSNTTETVNLLGSVMIDNVTFTNSGGNDIDIDGDSTGAGTVLSEQIAISDVTSSGGAAPSIAISNTTNVTGSATTITNFDYDGGATGQGGLDLTSTGSSTTVTQSSFTGGVGPAVNVTTTSGAVSIGSTNTISDIAGNAVVVTGNTGNVTINADIETASTVDGGTVVVDSNEATVSFGGDLTANNAVSVLVNNAQAAVNIGGVNGDITNTGAEDAIRIVGAGADDSIAVTINGNITNDGGRSVFIDNVDDTVQFVGNITDTGAGIRVEDLQSMAAVTFGPQVTLNTGTNAAEAVSLNNNAADSVVDFIGLDITTTTGDAIVSNGGELNVTGADNRITTSSGQALNITSSFSQSSGGSGTNDGIRLASVTATDTSGAAPISVVDYDGTVAIGSTGNSNDSTISSNGEGIVLSDVTNASVTNLAINTATGVAVNLDSVNSTTSSVALTDVTTPNGIATAVDATQAAAAGNLSVTIADSTMDQTTSDGLVFNGVDGTVNVSNTTLENGAGNGVRILNSDGAFTFADNVEISGKTGTAFLVDGGVGTVTYDGSVEATAGRSVAVQNKTGGSVNFGPNSTITDSSLGLLVNNNTGGTYNFLGTNDLDTGVNTAVNVTNNTGSTVTFAGLDIATTSGTAFNATGGGTVGVTGSGNVITTETGVGVNVNGMAIAGSGITFDKVDVGTTGPATNAVVLQNNTGGSATIGSVSGSSNGDGGSFNTSGSAVIVNNSGGLTMRNVDITAAGATAIAIDSTNATNMTVSLTNVNTPTDVVLNHTGAGNVNFTFNESVIDGSITANHSGGGSFDFNNSGLTVNSNIDVNATNGGAFDFFANDLVVDTSSAAVDGLNIALGGSLNSADISLTGSSTSLLTGDGSGLAISSTGSAKQIRFELSSGTITNDSVASNAFDFNVGGGSTLNATINGNVFTNANGGNDFLVTNGASSTTNLSLSGNDSASAGGLVLTNNNAVNRFNIQGVDGPSVNTDNNGDVTYTGTDANFTFNGSLNVAQPTN
ncbi:hypothetical protein Pla108_29330 [Botrimarina colliarenosi]|uniref:Inverse autotransporter beta-domain domain-containing protein n=1 Tax=Botrimarina colliarenosi TaxID=2528001 RepID=A0A5C6A8W1_9BACT|nr:hypothetical protein [Botrimarina colliarenosi]TWT95856.1 hypothetical protein Pla108_29330 [Botrimarina colliarenosi]